MANDIGDPTGSVSAADQVASIFSQLGGDTAAGPAVGAAGQWHFDAEKLQELITDWTALRNALQEDRQSIRRAYDLTVPPANDGSSRQHSDALRNGIRSLTDSHISMINYCQQYIDALIKAKDQKIQDENNHSSLLRRTAEG